MNLTDLDVMNELTSELFSINSQRKDEYYCHLAKQMQRLIGVILKTFFNGRKIPVIPPLLIDCKLVSDNKEKPNRFNAFFNQQCIPLDNASECPSQPIFVTNMILSSVAFDDKDIIKIIRVLNINKSHGNDISIRMIKIGDSALNHCQ